MAKINLTSADLAGDAFGSAFVRLMDESGNPIGKNQGETLPPGHDGLPTMVLSDGALRFARGDRMGNAGVALHTPLFDAVIDGATVNASQFATTAATQTITQATGTGIALNAAASVAANGSSVLTTLRKFTFMARGPVLGRLRVRLVKGGTNGVAEFGFGDPLTNTLLAVGAGWQYTAAGILVPFVAYNGTQITGSSVDAGVIDSLKYYWWDVIVLDDSILFVIQNPDTGLIIAERTIYIGADAGRMFSAPALGLFARTYVGAVAATAPATQIFVGQAYVGRYDAQIATGPEIAMAGMGLSLDKNPLAGAQTANATNSVAAVNATLSNTVAGYTTLGGRFAFLPLAGAATDYALFGFQVPAGYQANITDVTIDTMNTGVAVATTETALEWDIAINSTAVSLATAGIIRKGGLGIQSFPIGAAIGALSPRIEKQFRTPLVCESGRFVHLILRMPRSTATVSQVITGMASFGGFWSR